MSVAGRGLRLLAHHLEPHGKHRTALTGVQLLALSFFGLIAVGTAGLLWLPGLYVGPGLGFIDAVFTATSAVCVTGLIVVDTATYFTLLGQAWIALLIQLGGLGILTFTTLVISVLGRRASLGAEQATGGHAAVLDWLDARGLVRAVVALTLGVEAVGAAALWLAWRGTLGNGGAVWPAAFHAVSAFCNAGFSVFSDSLEGYQRSPVTLTVVGALIVLGGLGFLVIEDLRGRYLRRRRRRLSLHTTLVLGATALLLVGGAVLYLLFERNGVLAALPWPDRLTNALFMSVTARTAGFNTVDYNAIGNPSVFLTVILMLVGGSPGSTAGGVKTTTVALLVLLFISRLRGRRHVSARGRTVPDETIDQAAGLAIGAIGLLGITVFVLLATELPVDVTDRYHFMRIVFEAHSAFGTVGLSMGITPALSSLGKIVLTLLMYLGRVGPLTMAAAMAFAGAHQRTHFRYAQEDVIIG